MAFPEQRDATFVPESGCGPADSTAAGAESGVMFTVKDLAAFSPRMVPKAEEAFYEKPRAAISGEK